MIPLYRPEQVRGMDERAIAAGTASLDLMERAAGHLARAVLAAAPRRYGSHVVVLCGKGNNGGDGIAAARRLLDHGVDARVHLVAGDTDLSADAEAQLRRYRAVGGREMPALELDAADVVVDCILGTGSSGPAREPVPSIVRALHERRQQAKRLTVVACDQPSGVDADTGEVPGEAIPADLTVVVGAGKRGLWLWPARRYCGDLHVVDIGIADPPATSFLGGFGPNGVQTHQETGVPEAAANVMEAADAAARLAPAQPDADKRGRGVAVIVAGSAGMAGAAIMAARGALSMGLGLLTVATSQAVRDAVAPAVPEAMTLGLPEKADHGFAAIVERLEGADVLAIGPGLGRSQATAELVRRLVAEVDLPIVLDADGLNAFRGNADVLGERTGTELVVTPHAREFARLLGRKVDDVWPDRINVVEEVAHRWRATVVLKGPGTIIQSSHGETWINTTGSAALATGGTGDVLTGMLAAALPHSQVAATTAATVHVHGLAGEIAASRATPRSVAALDVAAAVPAALRSLTT